MGTEYRGKIAETNSGIPCQAWNAQSRHSHQGYNTPEHNPDADLENNYCRNPDNSANGPWCYTMSPSVRWEYCPVPFCQGRSTLVVLSTWSKQECSHQYF